MSAHESGTARLTATFAVATSLTFAAAAWAQPSGQHSQHHPGGSAASEQVQATPGGAAVPATGGAPGMMMQGDMMKGMMRRQAMSQADMAMPGVAMGDRIEGRLAFLRAELKITDAQTAHWNHLAQALRDNARKLGELRATIRQRSGDTPPTLPQRLEAQEEWFSARLEGMREIKTALSHLHASLSDEQKATGEQLLPSHLGLMPMGTMSMMGGMTMGGGMTGQGATR